MRRLIAVLLLTILSFSHTTVALTQVPCPVLPAPPTSPPSCPDVREKWDLWRAGTCLRGVNIWQKRVQPDDAMGLGPVGPPYSQGDFEKLASWGANYVNISHPGIFAEKPDSNGRYYEQPGVFASLLSLIEMCRKAGLFVVVAYRTGPERSEGVFSDDEKPLLKGVWESKDAQDAWVTMWAITAARLRDWENVVGYDLMVEPGLGEEGDEETIRRTWNSFADRIRKAIRSRDGGNDQKTPVLIGPAGGSSVDSLDAPVPPRDDRTVYAVHQYAPDEYAQTNNPDNLIPYPGGLPRMLPDLQGLYGRVVAFRARKGPVAVNEFGAVRYAPRAECYVGIQMELIERMGGNHALWLWETSWPLNYDQFNFRVGPDPANHGEVKTSDLIEIIKANWAKNGDELRNAVETFRAKHR